MDKLSSGSEDSSCLKQTRKRMGKRLSEAGSTRVDRPSMRTAGVAQFEYGKGNLSLTGNDIKVCNPSRNAL